MFYTEATELCPHCMGENVYPNWDVEKQGYIAICQHCNHQIFLCDECMHADDNLGQCCDWEETKTGSKCFRGEMKEAE